jgi:hypothetical protein
VLVVCHGVVVLIFRKVLERLSEQQLLTIDGDKAQEVRNCSVTHYEFDPNAGMNGKLILRDFNSRLGLLCQSPSLSTSTWLV